jgi:SAM-dependent methyltransferase
MQSFDRPTTPVSQPSPWILRFAGLIPALGPVLDVACGDGRHTRFLASRGHPVTAVDIDSQVIGRLAGQPQVQALEMDLEAEPWPFAPASFAGIVITNYLHRPHFAALPGTLRPGGVLLIETFAAGNERLGRPRNPDFLLATGELLAALGDSLQVVAYEHGIEEMPRPAVRQRVVAVRQTEPVALPAALVGAPLGATIIDRA